MKMEKKMGKKVEWRRTGKRNKQVLRFLPNKEGCGHGGGEAGNADNLLNEKVTKATRPCLFVARTSEFSPLSLLHKSTFPPENMCHCLLIFPVG